MSAIAYNGNVYVGDVDFQETEGSGGMSVDPWGFDTIQREYEGGNSALASFLTGLVGSFTVQSQSGPVFIDRTRLIQDTDYPALYLTEYSVEPGRAYSKVKTTSKGVFNGKAPQPVIEYGTKSQQVTLPFIGDEAGVTNGINASFVYTAPYATIRYIAKLRPTGPLFKSKLSTGSNTVQITARTGAAGGIQFFRGRTITNALGTVSSANIVGALQAYNAVIEIISESWDVKPLGQWWQVTEQNQVILTPLDLANSGWIYQLA